MSELDQTARTDREGVQETQPPKLVLRDEHGSKVEFLCNEDQVFWESLEPNKQILGIFKHLKSLEEKLQERFGSVPRFNHIWKILSRFLEGQNKQYLESGTDLISVHGFVDVTRWFGSFKLIPGDDTNNCYCLQQIGKLMQKGGQRKGKSFISWFAGFMTSDEAHEKLTGKEYGTYLVRFSESFRKEGGFALAVKGKGEEEILHYHLKGNLTEASNGNYYNAQLRFISDSREIAELGPFLDVVEVVKHLQEEEIDGIGLEQICPELPLNATFQGYR